MNRIEKLAHAEILLREVRGTLDRKRTPCECCERYTYNNWEEAQIYDRLTSTIKRCISTREWIRSSGDDLTVERGP